MPSDTTVPKNDKAVVDEVFKFIRTYGPKASLGTDEELKVELEWQLSHDRVLVVRDKGDIVGVFTGYLIDDLTQVAENKPVTESKDGKFAWIRIGVLHPAFQDHGFLEQCILFLKKNYPTAKYVYFQRSDDDNSSQIIPLPELIKGGDTNGRRPTITTSSSSGSTSPVSS